MFDEVASLFASSPVPSFDIPFPMGVFGTLRFGHSNHRLMKLGEIRTFKKAFMPNFLASGLSLVFSKESSAPFEIYHYDKAEWNKIIKSVDSLEGFRPNEKSYYEWGYHRTLTWLHVLPDDFKHNLLEVCSLSGDRDLKINPADWDLYPRVPCWVYSSRTSNKKCGGYPIIWD